MKCPNCDGKGMVDYPMYADDEHKWQYCVARMKKCDMCNGTGEVQVTEPKLKPCPFCGSNNVELRRGFAFNGAVHCNNCTADVVFDAVGLVATGNENWQKACIDGWNKRVVAE